MMVSEFHEAYRNRHQLAKQLKQSGKKVFGYFCLFTPQELIYAADVVPVRIRGSMDNPSLADAYLPEFVCSYMRSCLSEALSGKYNYLDGVIFSQRCDINRTICTNWVENVKIPYSWHVAMPRKGSKAAIEMYTQELRLLQESMEKYLGHKIDNKALQNAVDVYNENRSLRRKIYQLALKDSPPLPGSEVFEIMLAGLVMPKEEHSKMLRKLLDKLPAKGDSAKKVRLLLTGNTLENVEVLKAIERYGGQIVIDDFCFGTRDCWAQVDKESNPLASIAEYYLTRMMPSPCMDTLERRRIGHIEELIKEYRVQGVIQATQRYCDNYLIETPILERRLKEQGIPFLNIEIDDAEATLTRIDGMVQPFIEMLQ